MACSFLSSSFKTPSSLHQPNKHHCKRTAGPQSCVPSHLEAVKGRWASEASVRSRKPCPSIMGNHTQGLAVEMGTLAGKLLGI